MPAEGNKWDANKFRQKREKKEPHNVEMSRVIEQKVPLFIEAN